MLDFSFIRFLDRFAFKNPKGHIASLKKEEEDRELNGISPKYQNYLDADGVKTRSFKRNGLRGIKRLPPTSLEYAQIESKNVPEDEKFIHRFTSQKVKKQKLLKPKAGLDEFEDEVASVNSDDFKMIAERFEPGEVNEEFELNNGD